MEVQLRPEQEAFLQERVAAGEFASTDDAVRAAVEMLKRVPLADTRKLTPEELLEKHGIPGWQILEAFQRSPHKEIDIEPKRHKHLLRVRDIELP